MEKTIEIWRNTALKLGIGELYIGYMHQSGISPAIEKVGFDCSIEFQPDIGEVPSRLGLSFMNKVLNRLGIYESAYIKNNIYSYQEYAERIMQRKLVEGRYPGITPMWDNSARRKKGATIFKGATPEAYKNWLVHILAQYKIGHSENKFIFINAWNEWAEGNHLEPCQKWGLQYLEATKEAIDNA